MSEKPLTTNATQQRRRIGPMGGPMGHGPMGLAPGAKAKNFKRTIKQLLSYMKPFWWRVGVVIVFAIGSTIFAIIGPKILGRMTNQVTTDFINKTAYEQVVKNMPPGATIPAGTTGTVLLQRLPAAMTDKIPANILDNIKGMDLSVKPAFHYDKITSIAITLLILYGLSALFSYIQGWVMTDVSQKISYRLRRDISEKINRLPLKYFDAQTHGEVLSRVTNDVDTISQTLNQSLSQIVTSVTMILGVLGMMFSISWQMTLVSLVILPISLGLIMVITKKSQKYFRQQQDSLGHINGHIEEMYGGHNVMKVFNGQGRSIVKFNGINQELYGSAWKSQFLSGLMFPLMSFIGNLNYVGVTVLGGWLAVNGRVTIGDIQAFIQYLNLFTQPIAQTAQIANVLQSTAASAERVFEFLAEPEQSPDPVDAKALANIQGAVDFDQVHFGYVPNKEIIHGFNANIKPGQRIAIVGPTGAGKTTMVNLLMRFYDVTQGVIKVDGADINKMLRTDVRKLFGMVLQDTWLFNGTIRENIAYGKPEATNEEIEAAAKAAHVDHFIHALPGGYDMVLDEEANNISAGEKQLLTIARAMLIETPMLILDEATSSVDTRTEVLIQKAMDKLMHDKTCFIIAHRLSTIRNADLILVMNEGNIIEQGKHEELLKQNGFYANLYNSQFVAPIIEELPEPPKPIPPVIAPMRA